MGLARLLEQISSSPALDLVLSAVGVALFLLFIPIGLALSRARDDGAARWGSAFILGMASSTGMLLALGVVLRQILSSRPALMR